MTCSCKSPQELLHPQLYLPLYRHMHMQPALPSQQHHRLRLQHLLKDQALCQRLCRSCQYVHHRRLHSLLKRVSALITSIIPYHCLPLQHSYLHLHQHHNHPAQNHCQLRLQHPHQTLPHDHWMVEHMRLPAARQARRCTPLPR